MQQQQQPIGDMFLLLPLGRCYETKALHGSVFLLHHPMIRDVLFRFLTPTEGMIVKNEPM